jgi:hypothetical protein
MLDSQLTRVSFPSPSLWSTWHLEHRADRKLVTCPPPWVCFAATLILPTPASLALGSWGLMS